MVPNFFSRYHKFNEKSISAMQANTESVFFKYSPPPPRYLSQVYSTELGWCRVIERLKFSAFLLILKFIATHPYCLPSILFSICHPYCLSSVIHIVYHLSSILFIICHPYCLSSVIHIVSLLIVQSIRGFLFRAKTRYHLSLM